MTCILLVGKATSEEIITLGTLATEGAAWGRIFREMNAVLREESGNQLRFRFRFNQGEERLIEQITTGQLDAVSLTATGLGDILSETFVLQLPMLFSGHDDLDCVRAKLTPQFSEMFEREGYVFLGWGELGFIHIFSKSPIRTQADLQETPLWVWHIDPIAEAFAAKSGREPVVLPIQAVLRGLEQNRIQTVYAPPLGCIALQWHPQVKYMSDLRLAAGVGATIIRKQRYEMLSDEHQRLLRKIADEYHKQLIVEIRESHKKAIDALVQGWGIEIVRVSFRERQQWLEVAKEVQDELVGDLYSKELLEKVKSLLKECRQNRR